MVWTLKGSNGFWKQILLPRLTYGCHVWGHFLTQHHKSVERLALAYFAPMWKTTPTASLQIILNKKPSHIEVLNVGIKSYIRIKNLFQNNFWDDIPNNKRVHSHLATLKQITHKIIHEGIPLDDFESDYMREPSFSWNPLIHNTLTAVGENDIDDQHDFDDSLEDADSDAENVTMTPVDEYIQVYGGALGHNDAVSSSVHISTNYVEGNLLVSGDSRVPSHMNLSPEFCGFPVDWWMPSTGWMDILWIGGCHPLDGWIFCGFFCGLVDAIH